MMKNNLASSSSDLFDACVVIQMNDKMAQLKWAILESKIEDCYDVRGITQSISANHEEMEYTIHFSSLEDKIDFVLSNELMINQPLKV